MTFETDSEIFTHAEIWTAFATIAIAVYTRTLYRATKGLKESTDSLWDAGERQLSHLRDTAERQLRAYVSAWPDFMFSFGEGDKPSAGIKLHNTGATPAQNVRHRSNIFVAPEPLVANYRFPDLTEAFSAPVTLFPHLEFTARCTAAQIFGSADIAAIRDGTMRIYIYGELLYEDVFKGERRTLFCAGIAHDRDVLNRLSSRHAPADLKVRFEAAPMGNVAT